MLRAKRKMMIGLTAAVMVLFAFSACDTSSGYGVMEVSITDSPLMDDDVQGVYITIEEIQYHTTGDNWQTVNDFDGTEPFDLLALTRGDSRLLGELTLPAGEYTQIRFILGAPEDNDTVPASPGSWIEKGPENDGEFDDEEDKPLFVPSGAQTGYKASVEDGSFIVPVNGEVEITADFDLRRAVVKLGATERYILKPVLRLIVNNQAGEISGDIGDGTTLESEHSYVVYAYESGEVDDIADEAAPNDDGVRFANAVSSSELKDGEAADYVLAFLAEGTYDLYSAAYDSNGDVLGATSLGENVAVTAGDTTTHDLENVTWE